MASRSLQRRYQLAKQILDVVREARFEPGHLARAGARRPLAGLAHARPRRLAAARGAGRCRRQAQSGLFPDRRSAGVEPHQPRSSGHGRAEALQLDRGGPAGRPAAAVNSPERARPTLPCRAAGLEGNPGPAGRRRAAAAQPRARLELPADARHRDGIARKLPVPPRRGACRAALCGLSGGSGGNRAAAPPTPLSGSPSQHRDG